MQMLKQSTASQVVFVYLVDLTDGFSPEINVATPTVYLSKNGGAPAVPSSLAWAKLDDTNTPGLYKITLSAVDTDTVGPLAIDVFKSTVSRHCVVVCYVAAAILADVKTDTAAILADTGTDGVVLATATKEAIALTVWNELLLFHASAGTAGKALTDATAASNPWAANPATYTTPGTYGYDIARAIGGSGAGIGSITCQDEDDNPLAGVRCDVYTSATLVDAAHFWTGGMTNSSGVFTWYGPTGSYWCRRYKQGYGFTSDPVQATVS